MEVALGVPSLMELCIQATVGNEFWRVQRRQLACLPEDAANEVLRRLLERRSISPPQLELFQHCVTEASLAGSSITGPWLAYLGAFSALHRLRLHRCAKLRDAHLQHLAALAPTLQCLDLTGCSGISDSSAAHLLPLTRLVALDLSATGMGPQGVSALASSLTALTSLSLADVPADDACCQALGSNLRALQRLDLSATAVGDAGMRHLEQLPCLTALDLSLTQVHCPQLLASLRQLSMNSCALGLPADSAQEALWLHLGAALPQLQDLHLSSTTLQPAHYGEQLLQRLLAGAAGSLGQLDLRDCAFSGDLGCLAGASQLTRLDLSGTPVCDVQLAELALLPLAWASLSGTAVGDEGVGQLLAMATLSRLDLSKTRVGDGSWAVLAQLPALAWLDLSGSRAAFTVLPEGQSELATLTYLNLNSTQVDDRGCRHLAASAPQLRELWLGSKAVGDKGIRALCSLPRLERLLLSHSGVSDPGLQRALPRCPTLRHLTLSNCWLASAPGLQAAAAAARQAGGRLAEVMLDGTALPLPRPAAAAASASAGWAARAGMRPSPGSSSSAGSSGGVALKLPSTPVTATAPPSSASGRQRGTPLSPEVLAHDERLTYTRAELLSLAPASMPEAAASGGPAQGPAASEEGEQQRRQQLWQRLPPDLRWPA